IRLHKTRSALSFSAVAIGVGSLLYTFAQTHGMSEQEAKSIALIGPGRMSIEAKRDYVSKGLSAGLTSDDAEDIRRSLPELYMVYPKEGRWGQSMRAGGKKFDNVYVFGTTPEMSKRDWVYTRRGRWLTDDDVRSAARVCVLVEPGGWVEKPPWASFWSENPFELYVMRHDLLGQDILLGDHSFRVVGVIREPARDKDPRWNRPFWGDGVVIAPLTTVQATMGGGGARDPHSVETVEVDTGDEKSLPSAKRRIEAILKRRHKGEPDYEIKDMREEIEGQLKETAKYTLAATVMGAVAMLAGGIGILNVTLAALFARIKEIGIRRAVGATRLDILTQFVAEAVLLGLCGGAAGTALGLWGIDYLKKHSDRDLASLTWYHFVAALAIAAGTGLLFSLYPAWKAATLDPVDALRDE
ncbi:MAG: ABC transporter permease, partial [Elusimicrobia bacterium]|nr:ABC transporter permease [Elusimicrobiota bacterium]